MSLRNYQPFDGIDGINGIHEIDNNPPNSRLKCKSKHCAYSFCLLILLLLIGLMIFLYSINSSTPRQCNILQDYTTRPYPSSTKNTYVISFDQKLMQARYVAYIQPYSLNTCKSCKYFKMDPYGINVLRDEDYTNTGYDRGHLCPNADYGNDTYIISNVVPQLPIFNQQIWRRSEEMIRNSYKGKLIMKGCDYSDKYIMTQRNNKLYVPVGCSYAVFDSNDMNQMVGLKLLDYGYLENRNEIVFSRKLPSWMVCG